MRISYSKASSNDFQPSDERREALRSAMLLHGAQIYGYLCSRTGDAELAKDLSQETWLKVYRYFELCQFTEIGLLLRKARQVYLDHRRTAKIRSIVEFRPELAPSGDPAPIVSMDSHSEASLWEEFWNLFPSLVFDPVDQQCFWLIYRHNYTTKEVSERVGMPPSTIHDRVSRLVKQCREALDI